MKKNLLFLLVFLPMLSSAQRTAQLSVSGGMVHYIGDLANEKVFPFSSANAGAAVTIRNFINNPQRSHNLFPAFDLQLRLSWHRLQYDETSAIGSKQGRDLRNYLRGIGFRNDLFGTEADLTYNIYINRYAPLSKPRFSIFFTAGAGVFYGQPEADLFRGAIDPANRYYVWSDGTLRDAAENNRGIGQVVEKDGVYETNLRDWRTEGQGANKELKSKSTYSNVNFGFPLGGGIRYSYSKLITISAEFNWYFFMTDYLDDVSDRYATYEELHLAFPDATQFELAKYISDPTGYGTNGVIGVATSPRGNPTMKDSFTYLSIDFAYKLTWKGKGIYGQTK